MTTLLIDIGNTRLKWRAITAGEGVDGAIEHHQTGPAAGRATEQFLNALEVSWKSLSVTDVLYTSVAADSLADQVASFCKKTWPHAVIERIRAEPVLGGIVNGYDDPHALGPDRLLAMIGARHHFGPGALLVASLGTATTLDLVDSTGRFLGGAILPGPALMMSSLASGTARLPDLDGSIAAHVADIGSSTEAAMLAGVLQAQAGAIERAVRVLGLHHSPLRLVVSGGAGRAIAPYLPFPVDLADNLVLDGLAALAFARAAQSKSR